MANTFKTVSSFAWLQKPLSGTAQAGYKELTSEVDLYPQIGDIFAHTDVPTIEVVVAQEIKATNPLALVWVTLMKPGETPIQGRKILEFSPVAVGVQRFDAPGGNWVPEDMQDLDNLRFGVCIHEA